MKQNTTGSKAKRQKAKGKNQKAKMKNLKIFLV